MIPTTHSYTLVLSFVMEAFLFYTIDHMNYRGDVREHRFEEEHKNTLSS